MPDEPQNTTQRHQFALAMALGQRVAVWARKNEVPLSTCYAWRKTQEYKETVEEVRRSTLDGAVGHLVSNLNKATRRIVVLASAAQSESVQLQASRAVVRDLMKLREFGDLEDRMKEVECMVEKRKTGFSYPPPSNPDPVATTKSS